MADIDEALAKDIQAARKKPRNFLIIAKGANVLHVALSKKPIRDSVATNAKREYQGNLVVQGVVSAGEPPELIFQVLELPTLTDAKLRAFIKESAGITATPRFQVVPTLQEINESENESEQGETETTESTNSTAEPPPVPVDAEDSSDSVPSEDAANAFKSRLASLLPQIKAMADTPAGEEAKQKVRDAGVFAQKQDYAQANGLLDEIDKLLTASSSAPTDIAALASKLAQALTKLKPLLDQVINVQPERKGELQTTMVQIAGHIKNGQLSKAQTDLVAFGNLLKTLLAQAPPVVVTAPVGDAAAQFASRLKSIKSQLDELLAAGTPASNEAKLLAGEVATFARQKDFVQANSVLDSIELLLQAFKGVQEPVGGESISPRFGELWERAKTNWDDSLSAVNNQLEKLRVALLDEEDTEFEDALKRIAEFGLNAITADHKVPLQAAILDLDRAVGDAKAKCISSLRDLVAKFRDHIDSDERVDACDDNPFQVTVAIRDTLDSALSEMEQALSLAFAV